MREIPDPGFADDDGSAAPGVAEALAQVSAGAAPEVAVAALRGARVLVPVVALLGEVEQHDSGLVGEESAEMAAVMLTGRDGRKALLAFSSLSTLHAWNANARPVPVSTADAARAAISEGAAALVVDVAGPAQVPIEGDTLHRVALGQELVRTEDGWAWAVDLPRDVRGWRS